MHAFTTAILLGITRLDAFNANPQPEPPDGEFAQVEQGVGGSEGDAAIDGGFGQVIEQLVGLAIEHAIALPNSGLANGLSEMAFPGARGGPKNKAFS